MDVGHLRTTARSGSDFLKYGTGDVRVKSLGDQDEDVDIDDGDTGGTPPANVSGAGCSLMTRFSCSLHALKWFRSSQ